MWIVKIYSPWKPKVMLVGRKVVWSNLAIFWASRLFEMKRN